VWLLKALVAAFDIVEDAWPTYARRWVNANVLLGSPAGVDSSRGSRRCCTKAIGVIDLKSLSQRPAAPA